MLKKPTRQRIFLTSMVMLIFSSFVFSNNINFISIDFPAAAQKGMEEDKFFFVNFSADWCATCEIMEETANSHLGLTDYISENFIAIKANVESEIGKDWMQRFGVSCLPTLIVFSSNAEEVARSTGGVTASEFLYFLKNFKNSAPDLEANILDQKEIVTAEDQSNILEDDYNGATLESIEIFTEVKIRAKSSSENEPSFNKASANTFTEKRKPINTTALAQKYGIQVGMYAELKNANRKIEKMKKQSSQTFFLRQEKIKNKLLYQVVVGDYGMEQEAKQLKENLAKKGIKGYMILL